MANNKSILLIMPYGSVGGMERLALTFYNYYKSQGYSIKALKFIKLESDIINFGEDELYLKTKDFSSMQKKERLLFYFKISSSIKKIINKYSITHSIAFGDMANLFSSLSFSKEFKIGSIHALKSVELKNKTFFNTITKLGYKTSYKKLNKLVCISKAIKEDIITNCGYRFSNLEIIYNPHNIDNIKKLSEEPINEKKELDIFSKDTIVFLGRFSIQKSPWHLINAFHLLKKDKPDTNLVIIGDGDATVTEYVKKLITEYKLNDDVYLLGRKSNPYKYIAASKVLALSSYYEGTPNVIVESIAVGTPIVSSYCTKGIIELMSLKNHEENSSNITTESGIVTPNFFKGILEMPDTNTITNEENNFAIALNEVISNNNAFKEALERNKNQLLTKFSLTDVAKSYLSPITS